MEDIIKGTAGFLSQHGGWVTGIGIFLIVLVFVWSKIPKLGTKFKHSKRSRATIATSIGITFTFLGIAVGLLSFDTEAGDSVKQLIGGLQIAFLTSLAGVFFATILKWTDTEKKNTLQDTNDEKTNNDILQTISKSIDTLNKSLSGDEEGSLMGQVKLLRQDNKDATYEQKQELVKINEAMSNINNKEQIQEIKALRQENRENNEKLVTSVNQFADKVAKNQTEELIDALKSVLSTLNTTIQEQLGESFKQFSASVDNLVKWQSEYKDMIVKTREELDKVLDLFSQTNATLEQIKENNIQTSQLNENIKDVLGIHKEQLEKIETTLKSISNIPNTFQNIVENIESINKSYTGMSKNITEINDIFATLPEEIKKNNDVVMTSFQALEKSIKDSHDNIINELTVAVDNVKQSIPQITSQLDDNFSKSATKFRDSMEDVLNKLSDQSDNIGDNLQ